VSSASLKFAANEIDIGEVVHIEQRAAPAGFAPDEPLMRFQRLLQLTRAEASPAFGSNVVAHLHAITVSTSSLKFPYFQGLGGLEPAIAQRNSPIPWKARAQQAARRRFSAARSCY
jgi:hypothetical protein